MSVHKSKQPFTPTNSFKHASPGTFGDMAAATKAAKDATAEGSTIQTEAFGGPRRCEPELFLPTNRSPTLTPPAATRLKAKLGTEVEGVDCSWTTHGLKLHLVGNMANCPPVYQIALFHRGNAMEDGLPIEAYQIEEGGTLELAVIEKSEADVMEIEESSRPRGKEAGFAGTMLVTNTASPKTSQPPSPATQEPTGSSLVSPLHPRQ